MVGKKRKSDYDTSNRVLLCNVKKGSYNHKVAKKLTQIARSISNRANFIMRKDLFTGRKPDQSKVDKLLKRGVLSCRDKALYKRFPAAVSQRTIQIVGNNWSSFAAAKKDWKKHPEKYIGMPKPPKYVKFAKTVYIPCSSFVVVSDHLVFAKALGLKPIKLEKNKFSDQKQNPKVDVKEIVEVRLVPTGSGFKFEIIFNKHLVDGFSPGYNNVLLNKKNFIALDLGVSRFAALISNQAGLSPILINGGELKRINQWYNKRCATLRSRGKHGHIKAVAAKRNRKIKDKLHKISRFITDYCLKNDIGTVIVGKNKQWKTSINIGKRNNQNFTNLPHAQFIDILKYKLREIGIKLIEQEESYTSKASFLDNDEIPTYSEKQKKKPVFSGTRSKRGLYKSSDGTLVNADINGAANIARKAGYTGATLVSGGIVNMPILMAF